tara:strand:- start:7889 stop:9133 length:1245 start_codon:yes stop_codon:yes gene_type:complete
MMRKATLPTMRELGLSFDDLVNQGYNLRHIPEERESTFYQPQLLNKPANRQYEINYASKKDDYKKIPGLHTEPQLDMTLPRNSIDSYFVSPPTRRGILSADVTFPGKSTLIGVKNRNDDYGVDFWRTDRQGAGSRGGEGLIYGELPKENFVKIPTNMLPMDALLANRQYGINRFSNGMPIDEAFDALEYTYPEVHSIASQFPNVSTESTSWQEPAQYRGTNPILLDEIDNKVASEPMNIAMRLLKNEPADYVDTFRRVDNNIGADGRYMTDEELAEIDARYTKLHDDEDHFEEYYNLLEAIELEQMRRKNESFDGIGYNEETGFTRSEPMEIAMQLLKERVSPEAKRHKLEYDKKYESSPERVKYREELNRERRRRHIMGQGGPDMSHTKDHTIVPESPHTNRARHFKDKGTLL